MKYLVWRDLFFDEWFALETSHENIAVFQKMVKDCSFPHEVVEATSCLLAIKKQKNNYKKNKEFHS